MAVELSKPEQDSNINKPDFSQTLCTVLQLALVNLLRRLNVQPAAVVGHSSGEIAAA
jgi:acyl transferase domain-containing protein